MLQIGEFSIVTRLSVKTLRFYHNEGLLMPDYVDEDTGYRYYRESSIDRARVVSILREMEFPLYEIKEILSKYDEDYDIIGFLESQKERINNKINKYTMISSNIDTMIETIRRDNMKLEGFIFDVIEKDIDTIIFAGYRFKGLYSDVGKAFKIVGKKAGRYIADKPRSLYYESEYMENGADIEGGFPVSKMIKSDGISCRMLPGGRAVTLVHKGSYESIGRSYEKIFQYVNEKKLKIEIPLREIYIKGPGMIFKGNSDKYITEIQIFVSKESI